MNKKHIFILFASFLLCVSSVAQDKVSQYRYLVDRINGVYIPKDIEEAIDTLDVVLSEKDKKYVADSLSLESFCATTHMSLGMWIRNNWGLWGGSRLQRYFTERNVYHPDDMSDKILNAFYKKKIKGMEYSFEDSITQDTQPSTSVKVIKTKLGRFMYRLRKNWSRGMRENKREIKKEGFRKGKTVSFKYPYGCSTKEEQDIWLAGNDTLVPKGRILDIDYYSRQIKVELTSIVSPYGIIVFDGNLEADTEHPIERDFNDFTIYDPNRFYMQKGDVLWFGLHSHWQPIN